MKKTIVWHQGALGDLILSLPAIHSIRRHTEYLHLVARTDIADIVIRNGLADKVSPADSGLFAPLFSTRSPDGFLRDFLGNYDSSLLFMRRTDSLFLRNMRLVIPGSFLVETVPSAPGKHVADFQLDGIRAAAVAVSPPMPSLAAATPDAFSFLYPVIAIHPGSGGRWKRWAVERFLSLVSILSLRGEYDFVFLAGPAEDEDASRALSEFAGRHEGNVRTLRNRAISDVASLLKIASLYIGNDSGITHLASVLGTSTVALFGPTDPAVWGPRGEHVRTVRSAAHCSPCTEECARSCVKRRCLEDTGVRAVIEASEELLSLYPPCPATPPAGSKERRSGGA